MHLADDDDDDDGVTGGNTHAWVQVYVPGPGWVDFDPSKPRARRIVTGKDARGNERPFVEVGELAE